MPAAADGVVLLHGLGRGPLSMAKMERALGREGFRTFNPAYSSRHNSIDDLAADLEPAICRFAETCGQLHFVTHSMGGLLARVLIARHRPTTLGRIVMLGPPNRGSRLADLLHGRRFYRAVFGPAGQQLTTAAVTTFNARTPAVDVPLGIVAGNRRLVPPLADWIFKEPNDGKVAVEATRLDGMTDHLVVAVAHPWLMRDAEVVSQTVAFLRNGRFDPGPQLR